MAGTRRGRPRHPDILTPAEWRVLEALREGGTNAEMGVRLGISPDTVKYHISNMLGKLGLHSRRELAAWQPGRERGRLPALWSAPGLASLGGPVPWGGVLAGVALIAVAGVVVATMAGPALRLGGSGPGAVAPVPPPAPSSDPTATSSPAPSPSPRTAAALSGASPTETSSPAAGAADANRTPTPTASPGASGSAALPYDLYDATGAASAPGSYAFLSDVADMTTAVTTYEALRDGTAAGLIVNESDAHGASQAALYDSVAPGDLLEWRESGDCFVRYVVAEVKPDPPGPAPRRLLGVEWMTYAFTGCSGAVAQHAAVRLDWTPAPLTSHATGAGARIMDTPVRHGPWLLTPEGWGGALETPVNMDSAPQGQSAQGGAAESSPWPSSVLEEVREHPLWRDAAVPDDWVIGSVWAMDERFVEAVYGSDSGRFAARIAIWRPQWLPRHQSMPGGSANANVWEARTIGGYPAVLWYDPDFANGFGVQARLFDEASGIVYLVTRYGGNDLDAAIQMVLSMVQD